MYKSICASLCRAETYQICSQLGCQQSTSTAVGHHMPDLTWKVQRSSESGSNVLNLDMQGVAATVSQQYASMVSELLDMLQKTEQSLARVRRNKPADSAAVGDGSELSNIQKISLQLFLDVKVCF